MEQILNRKQLIDAVKNIPIVADREKWSITLDKEEGALYYAPEIIPAGSQLHQITDEYAVYLDANQNPQGVVVEYYRANFLKHHESFNEMSTEVFDENGREDTEVVVLDSKELKENKTANLLRALLESTLIKEAGTNFVAA
jgi:hypothetical protein